MLCRFSSVFLEYCLSASFLTSRAPVLMNTGVPSLMRFGLEIIEKVRGAVGNDFFLA